VLPEATPEVRFFRGVLVALALAAVAWLCLGLAVAALYALVVR
jgi:hypothetical protein